MLKQFSIGYENDEIKSKGIKAIQYNIHKKLRELKYITYKKIDILIKYTNPEYETEITWNDQKSASIECYINSDILNNLDKKTNVKSTYKLLFNCLGILWSSNGWNSTDLIQLYEQVEAEFFFVSIIYRKPEMSPDKKHKAEIVCDIFPSYADYYLVFLGNRNKVVQKNKFLAGDPDPAMTFLFFNNAYWRDNHYYILSNISQEIFYVFNVINDSFSIEFSPKHMSLEQCKKYIQAFQADVLHEEKMKLLGIPKSKK